MKITSKRRQAVCYQTRSYRTYRKGLFVGAELPNVVAAGEYCSMVSFAPADISVLNLVFCGSLCH
jgi:hypothetical protein